GGGAKSAKWLQIKSDILGTPLVRLNVSEAACLGAAILAGHAAGVYTDVAATAAALATPVDRVEPNVTHHRRHAERLELYQRVYPALRDVLHGI
ncbi:MAG: FGGY-family carbohydrate kinase, partial [Anaerolineae bacterium]